MNWESEYMGADWIKRNFKTELSEAGEAAANFLGALFLGIYHLNPTSLRKVDWSDRYNIRVTVGGNGFATVDDNQLTRLVVLAHDMCLRVEIEGIGPGYQRLTISKRPNRDGAITNRCPYLADHIHEIRTHYGLPLSQEEAA